MSEIVCHPLLARRPRDTLDFDSAAWTVDAAHQVFQVDSAIPEWHMLEGTESAMIVGSSLPRASGAYRPVALVRPNANDKCVVVINEGGSVEDKTLEVKHRINEG
jgi:hypothetical protein